MSKSTTPRPGFVFFEDAAAFFGMGTQQFRNAWKAAGGWHFFNQQVRIVDLRAVLLAGLDADGDAITQLIASWERSPRIRQLGDSKRGRILDRDGRRCRYCGRKVGPGTSTIDHVVPVSWGGSSDDFNLVTSCMACNMLKRDNVPATAGMTLRRMPGVDEAYEHIATLLLEDPEGIGRNSVTARFGNLEALRQRCRETKAERRSKSTTSSD